MHNSDGRIIALDRMAASLLNRHSEHEIAEAIEVLVDVLDLVRGDPDLEPGGDDEPLEANGDTRDAAWIEWQNMRGSQKRGPNIASENEDDEEDNEDCGFDEGEPDFVTLRDLDDGAGCPIADPGEFEDGL
jgi:hypothetical protein